MQLGETADHYAVCMEYTNKKTTYMKWAYVVHNECSFGLFAIPSCNKCRKILPV